MRILAIETSCDETAVALLECSGTLDAPVITPLSQALYSQTKEHAPFGGVFPALAKREHVKNIVPLTLKALEDAQTTYDKRQTTDDSLHDSRFTLRDILSHEDTLADDVIAHILPLGVPNIDAIAVTRGPGLEPALWVGLNFAKALSYAWNIPLIPTNHMEGHIASVLVDGRSSKQQMPHLHQGFGGQASSKEMRYPAIALLVSGGHTELIKIDAPLSYERIGQTRDDAVGEAYDKVARLLGLPYPGGPEISKRASHVRDKFQVPSSKFQTDIKFPRPMIKSDDFDFSFAGLKTAVLYKVRELSNSAKLGTGPNERADIGDDVRDIIAYEFEEAAIDTLVAKTKKALEAHGASTLIVGGGVIANAYLRERLETLATELGVALILPTRELSTDNALMIGAAAYLHHIAGEQFTPYAPGDELKAEGTLRI